MYSGEEFYDDDVTSGPIEKDYPPEGPVPTSVQNAWNNAADRERLHREGGHAGATNPFCALCNPATHQHDNREDGRCRSCVRFGASVVDEALNSGDGSYRP